jgi:hypothetical protein
MYTKQYHVFQPIQLTSNITLPSVGPINIVGGNGGTVTVPATVATVSGFYATKPAMTIDVTGGTDPFATVTIPSQTVPIDSGAVTFPEQADIKVNDGGDGGVVTIPSYDTIDISSPDNSTQSINAFVAFPVKKIKISFAYSISSRANTLYSVTSDIVSNDIVGFLNNFSFLDNTPLAWYNESLKETNVFSYIFRDPIQVSGQINFTFTNQIPSNAVVTNNVVVHLEFLG